MAHAVELAVGRVEPFGAGHEALQLAAQRTQPGDAAVELVGASPEQVEDVAARRIAVIAQGMMLRTSPSVSPTAWAARMNASRSSAVRS